ncbi:hypothetical protein [Sphingobacterium sp. xlx-96]|uniref:hypothetical protein n=1 Tax=Sphingobacterium sp. xlx-96 TaxID=2654322 RepID=UPI0013DA38EE|nr:hypothetical protein [Sphingobacterium sp. xlx-96]
MVTILFLSVYLTTFTPFKEVWKLPILIEHFMEHRAEDPSISISAFLDMHYMQGNPRDADYERDMQLPFKVISHAGVISVAIPPSYIFFQAAPPLYNQEEKPILYDVAAYSFNFHRSIWQPPKSC